MPTLKPNSIRLAIRHIVRFGDTDIFPPLPGIAFLKADEQSVVNILSKVEPGAYTARTAINSLAPKGRLGFRNAQQ
ncbi:MAG: reverse transcriptase, partial [Alphaproteobacteria bacterium]|nr:reverse transcriptase [Alphaproteobacteria bacterium]